MSQRQNGCQKVEIEEIKQVAPKGRQEDIATSIIREEVYPGGAISAGHLAKTFIQSWQQEVFYRSPALP